MRYVLHNYKFFNLLINNNEENLFIYNSRS